MIKQMGIYKYFKILHVYELVSALVSIILRTVLQTSV